MSDIDSVRAIRQAHEALLGVLDTILPKNKQNGYFSYGAVESAIDALKDVASIIDRLTTERDALSEQVRRVVELAEQYENERDGWSTNNTLHHSFKMQAERLRNALNVSGENTDDN